MRRRLRSVASVPRPASLPATAAAPSPHAAAATAYRPGRGAALLSLLGGLLGVIVDGRALAQCPRGLPAGTQCGAVTGPGCCDGHRALYCYANLLCAVDCSDAPACGWNSDLAAYDCATSGAAEPSGHIPRECPTDNPGTNPCGPIPTGGCCEAQTHITCDALGNTTLRDCASDAAGPLCGLKDGIAACVAAPAEAAPGCAGDVPDPGTPAAAAAECKPLAGPLALRTSTCPSPRAEVAVERVGCALRLDAPSTEATGAALGSVGGRVLRFTYPIHAAVVRCSAEAHDDRIAGACTGPFGTCSFAYTGPVDVDPDPGCRAAGGGSAGALPVAWLLLLGAALHRNRVARGRRGLRAGSGGIP